jgi:hypothetical protein
MPESEKNAWSAPGGWAKCREPYKTQLDAIANGWIEGTKSHADAALELWTLRLAYLDKVRRGIEEEKGPLTHISFTEVSAAAASKMKDVESDVHALSDAVCNAALPNAAHNPEERRMELDVSGRYERGEVDLGKRRI